MGIGDGDPLGVAANPAPHQWPREAHPPSDIWILIVDMSLGVAEPLAIRILSALHAIVLQANMGRLTIRKPTHIGPCTMVMRKNELAFYTSLVQAIFGRSETPKSSK
jgi:hypothetical protein